MSTAAVSASELQRELETTLSGEVRFDAVSRALYSTDASVYQIEPVGVVAPANARRFVRLVQICARQHCPITMRGGGTSQAGQAIGAGLIVDTSKYLNRMLEVNVAGALGARRAGHRARRAERAAAAARPAVRARHLDRQPRHHRRHDGQQLERRAVGALRQDDRPRARAGGRAVGRLASCTFAAAGRAELDAAVRRRHARGALLSRRCAELAATHADEIERAFPEGPAPRRRLQPRRVRRSRRRPFNLAQADRRLGGHARRRRSRRRSTWCRCRRPRRCWRSSSTSCSRRSPRRRSILAHRPSAVEVMDGFILDHTRKSPALDAHARTASSRAIRARCCASSSTAIAPRTCRRGSRRSNATCARTASAIAITARSTSPAQARIWSLREAALGLSMAMKGDAKSLSFVEDTAVAPERLRDYIERFLAIVARHGTTAGVYAHASVGCLHVRPVVNLKTADGVQQFEAIANDIADLVLEFGGALSGEHGDGLVRSPFMEKMFGPVLYEAFRTIKQTFDPHGLFNPGKIVDAPPLTANLRYGAGVSRRRDPTTFFDYAETAASAGAVEMCSGLGACRKTLDGTMCPSYMATRDEQHSTRGRANVLRLAMAGRLGEAGLGDEGVHEVLDLCLECRACKAECPGRRRHGALQERVPRRLLAASRHAARARALGHIHALAEWGSRFAPLSNCDRRQRAGRWLNEQLLGIDRRRRLPQFTAADARAVACRERRVQAGRHRTAAALQRHLHQLLRPRDRARRDRGAAAAGVRTAPRAERLLRPAADLAGPARRGARDWPSATPTRSTPTRAPAGRSCSASRAACRPFARTRRRCCAASAAQGARSRRASRVLFEEFVARARGNASRSKPGPEHGAAARPLPSEGDGRSCAPAKALLSRIPGCDASSISTPAAAAWPARSATGASTTTCRARSASAGCCPPCAAKRRGAVLVAAGTSCRHQSRRLHRRRRRCIPACCCARSISYGCPYA